MGLIPDQTARHEITNRVSIHSALNDAPCGIGEQVVNFSVNGTIQNTYSGTTDHLAVPFHAGQEFTPLSFDFELLVALTSGTYIGVILDETGTVVAYATTVTSSGTLTFIAFTTNPLLPAGLYYQMLYLSSAFTTGGPGCFGSLAANKIPNLRAMGCFSVSMNSTQAAALAIGQNFTLNPVASTVLTNVPMMWVRCLTNV